MVRIGRRAELRKNTEPEEGGIGSQKVVNTCHFFIENSLRRCTKPKNFSHSARIIHQRMTFSRMGGSARDGRSRGNGAEGAVFFGMTRPCRPLALQRTSADYFLRHFGTPLGLAPLGSRSPPDVPRALSTPYLIGYSVLSAGVESLPVASVLVCS